MDGGRRLKRDAVDEVHFERVAQLLTVNASGAIHRSGIDCPLGDGQYSCSYCEKAIAQSVNLIV